ncbi:MAG: cbb3-type cytochrome c oxidase subunit 3 [Myxococcota bacterium]
MFKQHFSNLESIELPLFGLWLFIGIFLLVLVRTFVLKPRGDFDAAAQLPLNDGTPLPRTEAKP